ncbi:DUF2798 domain-containing protein [Wohlfahrtiimonas larvae]|uniref:DUF2798 domain-containing protein n=1 Tax=Wohlfahrtiimonas larvae TaxID=1157986 RepID=A0ABP9MJW9_9GAMM|nr:DUF2798 domain-containing protein [Wohlfahrtiimonas larvae]
MPKFSLYYVIYSVIVSFCMSFIMSGTVTFISIGANGHFFSTWLLKSFPLSYMIALPIALFVIPTLSLPAKKIADYIALRLAK